MGLILVRYGEIALKGGNRRYFIKKLCGNIRDCLAKNSIEGTVWSVRGRLYVEATPVEKALDCLSRVFGIVSLSPVTQVPSQLEAINSAALEMARQFGLDKTKSFRVRARRSDKSFPLTSPEIGREVGGYIQGALGAPVDLSEGAGLTIGIEVRREGTLIYGQIWEGPGGLPLSSGGRAVALLSGGIASPVAAWMMMKRGCGVIPVHFAQSDVEKSKALDNCAVLERYAYGWEIRPIILSHEEVFGEIFRKLQRIGEQRWACIFCKRALLLKAAEVAQEHGAHAIVTGENVGQVASQTLENLEVISYGVPKPILRPLIGFDKVEITALAKRIGTLDISTRDATPCLYLPQHPITAAKLEDFRRVLARLELA